MGNHLTDWRNMCSSTGMRPKHCSSGHSLYGCHSRICTVSPTRSLPLGVLLIRFIPKYTSFFEVSLRYVRRVLMGSYALSLMAVSGSTVGILHRAHNLAPSNSCKIIHGVQYSNSRSYNRALFHDIVILYKYLPAPPFPPPPLPFPLQNHA